MIMIHFQKNHGLTVIRTFERVITEGMQNAIAPTVEGEKDFVFFSGNGKIQFFIGLFCSGIETVVADLFKVFFWAVLN